MKAVQALEREIKVIAAVGRNKGFPFSILLSMRAQNISAIEDARRQADKVKLYPIANGDIGEL